MSNYGFMPNLFACVVVYDWKMRRGELIFIDPWVVKATLIVSAIIIHCYLHGEKLKIEDIAVKQIV